MTSPSTNSDSDTNIAYHIWIGTIVTVVPATIAVVLRYVSRLASRAGFWWDDYLILVSLIINWGMAVTRWCQIIYFDYGRHAEFLPEWKVQDFQKSFIAVQITYFTNAVCTKASLLLLYHRIFGVVAGFRWALWISGAIITAYFIACVIVSIAGCTPASYFWNKNQPGFCIDEVNFFRWNGIVNLLLDVLVLALPFPMTWRVKTNTRQKLVLSGIFLLGGFVCIVSILRITSFNQSNQNDPTYTSIDTAMWSSIEQSVGIVCACLPTLRPLFRRLYGASAIDPYTLSNGSHSQSPSRSGAAQLSDQSRGDESSTVEFARLSNENTLDRSPTAYEMQMYPGHKPGIDMGESSEQLNDYS